MYQLKIEKIILKNKQEIEPKKINIIIGPNNSGKSKFLKEIGDSFYNSQDENYIINDIKVNLPQTYEEFFEDYKLEEKIFKDAFNNDRLRVYSNYGGNISYPYLYPKENADSIIKSADYNLFCKSYGSLFLNYLGTENRLTMIKSCDYEKPEYDVNFLTDLHNRMKVGKGGILDELAENTKELFDKDILLDCFSDPGRLVFRVSENLDDYKNAVLRDYDTIGKLSHEKILDKEGDGIKSFVSTYLSLKYDEKNIVLIDEPEAFLHPPLARQLGEIIGESSSDSKQIFIATHSSEILKGILTTCNDVNIVRITRQGNVNNIKLLENEELKYIIKTPKLRVSKILDGLFCEKVVITESEADEIFYQEVLEKISPKSGVFFTHVNSKDNIVQASKIYNNLGVENAMIFDFDVIRNDGSAFFRKLLELEISDEKRKEYLKIARDVDLFIDSLINKENESEKTEQKIREEKGKYYHKFGIRIFKSSLKENVETMIDELAERSMYILKNGELETTLEEFGIKYTSNKKKWIADALEKIDELDKEMLEISEIGNFVKKMEK